ncbi:MAG: transposase [Rhizobacter sp.]|nr:transposase [Rhizobacter sp.]
MTMNRVQFQPGRSMAEFMDRYGSDDKCEAALIDSRWLSGFACPACSCGCGHSSSFRRQGRLYFQCTACRHQCSVIAGTIFEATKLGLSRWFLAMHQLTQSKNNIAALELMRHLGVCYASSGSIWAGQSSRHTAGERSQTDSLRSLRYLFQNASTAIIRRRFSVVT